MKRILLIEDDVRLARNIADAFSENQFAVENVYDGLLAEKYLRKEVYDCVIMDVNLPGKTGFDLCKEFRLHNLKTPVLMLTAFSDLEDKVQGFSSGADDYLSKPFYMRELTLRVESLIRRAESTLSENQDNTALKTNDIVIDLRNKKVIRRDREIILTPREFQILVKLVECKGELVSKRDLIKEIWGTAFDTNSNTIEVYINFLRNKLDKPYNTKCIKTKVGYGYYFEDV